MTDNEILLTPGPTHVPLRIFEAMQQPTLHHRTETFKKHLLKAREGIQWLTRTSNLPIFIAGSGTAAMEAALLNTCQPGDQIIVLNAGKFGERWLFIAERLQLKVKEIRVEWGKSISKEELEPILRAESKAKAICLQHCETSTAVQHAVSDLCSLAKSINPNILTIVDSVSAIATTPIYVDEHAIDILVAAAHKGLMMPPGLSLIIANSHAWKVIEKNKTPSLYFDLLTERKAASKDTTAWTPAMNHIVGLTEAIQMIREEGEENVYARHLKLSKITRDAFTSLNLSILAKDFPSPGVSAAIFPDGIDAEVVRGKMLKNHGVRIAGGQDELKGKIIRFGHMGYTTEEDIQSGISALRTTMKEFQ